MFSSGRLTHQTYGFVCLFWGHIVQQDSVGPCGQRFMQLWKSELRHFATTQVILSRFHVGVERQDQPPSEGLMRFKSPAAAR